MLSADRYNNTKWNQQQTTNNTHPYNKINTIENIYEKIEDSPQIKWKKLEIDKLNDQELVNTSDNESENMSESWINQNSTR